MESKVVACFDSLPRDLASTERTKKKPDIVYLCQADHAPIIFRVMISRLKDLNRNIMEKCGDIGHFYEYLHCVEGPGIFPTMTPKSGKNSTAESPYKELLSLIYEMSDLFYKFCCVGTFVGKEDEPYTKEDFGTSPHKARLGMKCYDLFLMKLYYNEAMKEIKPVTPKHTALNEAILHVKFYLLLLVVEQTENNLWTDVDSLATGKQLLQKMMETNQMATIQHLLCSCSTKVALDCNLVRILNILKPRFTKSTWKMFPTAPHVYTWCLFNVKNPFIQNYIDQFMPPALVMADDFRIEYKLLGIKCFNHFLANVNLVGLKDTTHAHVMYDCLQKMTFTHKVDLLKELHPCLLRILAVIEEDPKRGVEAWKEYSRYDVLFQRLLNDMNLEIRLELRRQHSEYLPQYVEVMGITVVKHLKRFLQVVDNYIRLPDGPRETTRINILRSLSVAILECWPRIPNHADYIMKSLTTMLLGVETLESEANHKVKKTLTDLAVECLELLKRCCPEQYDAFVDNCVNTQNEDIVDTGMQACMKYFDRVKASE